MIDKTKELPDGYKYTELGVIPEDWEVKSLGELGDFKKGKGICKDDLVPSGIPCVRYGELYTTHHEIIQEFNSFITEEISKYCQIIQLGDILFAGSGETKEEIGKCAAYLKNEKAYAGGDIIIFSPSNRDSKFLGFLLNQKIVVKQKSQKAQGDAIVHIYMDSIKKIIIPVPPLPEQKAIAEVLTDTDELIRSLDALIEKKKNVKQGMMQELLTGKRRLPGYGGKNTGYKTTELGVIPEDWDVKTLGELIFDYRGGAPLKPSDFINEGIKVLPKLGVGEGGILFVPNAKQKYCSNEYCKMYPRSIVDKNYNIVVLRDLVPSGPSIGYVVEIIDNDIYLLAQGVYGFRVESDKLEARYIIYLSNSNWYRKYMQTLLVGSTQVHIRNSDYRQIQIPVPPLPEQKAIAEVLFDMDAEIEALEQKREKMKLVKLGMMQDLLTGRIRLV